MYGRAISSDVVPLWMTLELRQHTVKHKASKFTSAYSYVNMIHLLQEGLEHRIWVGPRQYPV